MKLLNRKVPNTSEILRVMSGVLNTKWLKRNLKLHQVPCHPRLPGDLEGAAAEPDDEDDPPPLLVVEEVTVALCWLMPFLEAN